MSSPFQKFSCRVISKRFDAPCALNLFLFFGSIFGILILSKSVSFDADNLLIAPFLILRAVRGLNNAHTRVHYTPRGTAESARPDRCDRRSIQTAPRSSPPEHPNRRSNRRQSAPIRYRRSAQERTAGRKPEQCRRTGYHAGQLIYYHVTISKL